ncbi:MAG: M23 family metallopeptidase [Kofleriaceae bacterium]|nr:M23 family metallopeptidase [Kofleriaceae bacterium]
MRFASALAALALCAAIAHAETVDPKAALADQLAAELDTLAKTTAIVDDKLADADAQRLRRIRAAYRILHGTLDSSATAEDRMAAARRRAAARLLLERDRDERMLLANEASQLRTAEAQARQASTSVASLALPTELLRPVKGQIARAFGTYQHERSRATLTRRGLDFEVEQGAAVVAPADGTVRYAGPMRGLEDGLVLDHGDYYTVVAKLADLAIPVGTKVLRGDRIGRALRHRVYLEVRAKVGPGGLPIDPAPLLR